MLVRTQTSSPRAGKADRKELSPCTEMAVLQLPLMVETLEEAPGAPACVTWAPQSSPNFGHSTGLTLANNESYLGSLDSRRPEGAGIVFCPQGKDREMTDTVAGWLC